MSRKIAAIPQGILGAVVALSAASLLSLSNLARKGRLRSLEEQKKLLDSEA